MSRTVSYFRLIGWLLITPMAGLALLLSSFYLYLQPALPQVEQLRDMRLQTPLRVYSRDRELIAEFGEMRRTPLGIEDVSSQQIQAFLAAEDSRFESHQGVDLRGLARASYELATTGGIQSGGSTITMQVAKNFFLTRDRTFLRKFNEILLALQIERELSKDEIMELYLNKIYLGNRAYGIESAARVYYGKQASELNLAEKAMIAGLPKAPSAFNPLANPERAVMRRNWILSRMEGLGYIDSDAYQQARSAPVTARYHGPEVELSAPYIAEMARAEAFRRYGQSAYEDGYRIYTSVESERQQAATESLRDGLEAYDRRHGYRGPVEQWSLEDSPDISELEQRLRGLPRIADLVPALITDVDDQAVALTPRQGLVTLPMRDMRWARRYINVNTQGETPETPSDVVSRGDVVYIRLPIQTVPDSGNGDTRLEARLAQVPDVQGAVVSMDPNTGALEALSGGYSFAASSFNRATQARRQPGSAFKPLVFLAALENGATAATTINDAPIVFDDDDLETTWRPENVSGQFGGPTTLRRALYQSRNLVAIRLLRETGIRNVLNYVESLGLDTSALPGDLSLALGSGSMTPMELTRAYAIIANGGYAVEPYLIERIVGPEGDTLFEIPETIHCDPCDASNPDFVQAVAPELNGTLEEQNPKRIMERVANEQSIYIMHSMMRDVISRGTGRRAQALGREDLAGKTGTTNDQHDTWFMGFNPDVATGTWVGFDSPQPLGRGEFGSVTALPIWQQYMDVALRDRPEKLMAQPSGIVSRRIDPETGEPAPAGTRNARFEIFRAENAPEEVEESDYREKDESADDDERLPQQLF